MSLLNVQNLEFGYGEHKVLTGLDLNLKQGQVTGLIGPNGAGKSTLLKLVAGLLPNYGGRISLKEKDLQKVSPRQRAHLMAYLPQTREVHWPLDVQNVLQLGRFAHHRGFKNMDSKGSGIIQKWVQYLSLEKFLERKVTELSGGEQALVLLGRALVTEAPLLLIDEPFSGLDPFYQFKVIEALKTYCLEGGSVLIVFHELALAKRLCDDLALIWQGELKGCGPVETVLKSSVIGEAYGVKASFDATGNHLILEP